MDLEVEVAADLEAEAAEDLEEAEIMTEEVGQYIVEFL